MSPAGELAARISKQLAKGQIVPVSDQMRLRYLAQSEERTLPLEEIVRRILSREYGDSAQTKAAEQ